MFTINPEFVFTLIIAITLIVCIPFFIGITAKFIEERFLKSLHEKIRFLLSFMITILFDFSLTWLFMTQTGWTYWESHFTIGLLLFSLVFMMQYNRYTGERDANFSNRYYGGGKTVYKHKVFELVFTPSLLATLLFCGTGITYSLIVFF